VCRKLRELYPHQALPIIMVSARVEEEAVVSGLDVGAGGCALRAHWARIVGRMSPCRPVKRLSLGHRKPSNQ